MAGTAYSVGQGNKPRHFHIISTLLTTGTAFYARIWCMSFWHMSMISSDIKTFSGLFAMLMKCMLNVQSIYTTLLFFDDFILEIMSLSKYKK